MGNPSNSTVDSVPESANIIGRMRRDPRIYQIGALSLLFLYGWTALQFDLGVGRAALIIGATLGTQLLCTRLWRLDRFDPRSALISALSLCLLLRTNSEWLALCACVIAIASKFIVRIRGKHLFNPTNFALVVLILWTEGRVWVSPGQWGAVAFFGFLIICLGGWVVYRAARSDVAVAFLLFYSGLLIGRSWWLGEPLTIPLHRLESGALLLFAFFMISDPKTTPDSRFGRILFAGMVALGAAYVQFKLFRTNGLLWSLAVCSLFVPVIDGFLPGRRYQWVAPAKPSRMPVPANRGVTPEFATTTENESELKGTLNYEPALR